MRRVLAALPCPPPQVANHMLSTFAPQSKHRQPPTRAGTPGPTALVLRVRDLPLVADPHVVLPETNDKEAAKQAQVRAGGGAAGEPERTLAACG